MVLGLLVVGASLQVYLGAQTAYRYNQALAAVHDRARFALYALTRDLRMSGYTGCAQGLSAAPSLTVAAGGRHARYGSVNIIARAAIAAGVSANGVMAQPLGQPRAGELPAAALASTDAIRIAYMRDAGVRVADAPVANDNIKITANPARWDAGDILLVTDCVAADIFAATNIGQSASGPWITVAHAKSRRGNNTDRLSRRYPPNARVLRPAAFVYYIGASSHTDAAGNALPALYRKPVFPAPKPAKQLVLGISALTLRYGVDTDNDQSLDRYVAATSVLRWENVLAVRLGFVAASARRSGGANPALKLFGSALDTPDDGRLRRVFSTTVALRTRVP